VLFVAVVRGLSRFEVLGILGSGAFLAVGIAIQDAFDGHKIGSLMEFSPLIFLAGCAFGGLLFSNKMIAKVHEGEVALLTMTYFYALTAAPWSLKVAMLVVSVPLVLALAMELGSWWRLADWTRFAMAVLVSLTSTYLCFYQASFLIDVMELRHSDVSWWIIMLQSVSLQLSAFWGCFHVCRLIQLMPGKRERNYFRRLQNETLPEFVNSVLPLNVPYRVVSAAILVHGFPLVLNYHYQWFSVANMLSYSILLSPVVVDFVVTQLPGKPHELPLDMDEAA
jgi:hypothetical protein